MGSPASRVRVAAVPSPPRAGVPASARRRRLRGDLSGGLVPALSLSLTACACAGAPAPSPAHPAPRSVGPLLSLVPDGARLVIRARPRALMADPATRRVVRAVFDDAQMERYRARTGVDPRALDELVVALSDEGAVILARGLDDARFTVREAGARMAPLEASVDEPIVRRVGFVGAGRLDLSALDYETVAWIDGTPQLAASVLATARRPAAERAPPSSTSQALLREVESAPFALLAPRPLGLPRDTGIGMLFAREQAAAVAARPTEDGALVVQADVAAELPEDAHENLRAFAASIARSDLGAALGARDALPSLVLEVSDGWLRARARVDPAVLAAGLRAVLVAEIRELVEGPAPGDQPAPGDEPSGRSERETLGEDGEPTGRDGPSGAHSDARVAGERADRVAPRALGERADPRGGSDRAAASERRDQAEPDAARGRDGWGERRDAASPQPPRRRAAPDAP